MKLIDLEAKKIMEEYKQKAKEAGLTIEGTTLEYIVTSNEILELMPKMMIPTLYDYWVHDINVIKNKWIYDVFPHNPFEIVINTKPPISFYNVTNPNWLNEMIFYHVIAHIDFFQNNIFFKATRDKDFCNQALADKIRINKIRENLGSQKRWVDYVIEFARSIDNLVGYYLELEDSDKKEIIEDSSERLNFYFADFLKQQYQKKLITLKFYYDEIERYNNCLKKVGKDYCEDVFFNEPFFKSKFPEFQAVFLEFLKNKKKTIKKPFDIMEWLLKYSKFLNEKKNRWMKEVIEIIRRTSIYFQPQLRTKICNEGWATFWHRRLYLMDDKLKGHEIDFALVNAKIAVAPRLGLNPYILGENLFEFIELLARQGKLFYEFSLIKDREERKRYDKKFGEKVGKEMLFKAREKFNDYLLINFLSDENFQDFVDYYDLFVAGTRYNSRTGLIEIYIKSRSGKDYRKMLNDYLYHPPYIVIVEDKSFKDNLYLNHIFEGRSLVTRYIPSVLKAISYLMGGETVYLETTEFEIRGRQIDSGQYPLVFMESDREVQYQKIRVLYSCKGKDITRTVLFEY